jgi:hypothetical protein
VKDEPKISVGKIYTPKKHVSSDNEVVGNYWRAWCDGDKYFYEYDEGHFATKFKVVQISKKDFLLAKSGEIADKELTRKYFS